MIGIDVEKVMKPSLDKMDEMNENLKVVIRLLEEVKSLLEDQND